MDLEKMTNIAQVCHEANRSYCESLGDTSQVPWAVAPDWQKESCINGVRFRLENPEAPASASHENWMKHKLADGWKYGDIKDPEKKEHPCMVPFEQLPLSQQIKDHLFMNVVKALAQQD